MFTDELLAVNEVATYMKKKENIYYFCNLDENVGLPRVREHARIIKSELKKEHLEINEITGGLDEYATTNDKIIKLMKNNKYCDFDILFVVGVPHIISLSEINNNIFSSKNYEIISITNGPRQVIPLRKIGHKYIIVEMDLHPKTLGIKKIIKSEFGTILRSFII